MKKITLLFCAFVISITTLGLLSQDVRAFDIDDSVYATAVQSDGKILIGGRFTEYEGVPINRIARINSDGTLDTSFDPGSGADGEIRDIEIMPNGKIVISGGFYMYDGAYSSYIARLNSDGSLDTSFNIGETINSYVMDAAVQPDGKVVIGGWFLSVDGASRNYIARLNVDGSLDTSFSVGTGGNNDVLAIAIQPDGKILIGGRLTTYNGTTVNRVARLNTNGSLDTSFDSGTGAASSVEVITLLSSGQMYIGGDIYEYDGVERNGIARLNSDGSLDMTFDSSIVPMWNNNIVVDIDVQSDGKVIMSGDLGEYGGEYRNSSVLRLNSDGSFDTTFNANVLYDSVYSTGILTDGGFVIGGNFNSCNFYGMEYLAILYADGAVNPFLPPIAPDSLGLTEQVIPNEYQGGGIAQGWQGSTQAWTYNLPFSFHFYGNDYSSVKVSSNGYLCFGSGADCTENTDILTRTNNGPVMAVAGSGDPSVSMFTDEVYITENPDNVVIRWQNYNGYSYLETYDFEVILYDDGNFLFSYDQNNSGTWSNGMTVGTSSGSGTYTRSIYNLRLGFDDLESLQWGTFTPDGGTPSSTQSIQQNLNITVSENLTLDCGNDIDLDNGTVLTAGTPQTAQTTCTVTTNDQSGYTLSLINDRTTNNTLYHTTQSTNPNGQIQDKTPWTTASPNATNWSGTGLGFGITTSDASKNETWWGNANNCNDTNQKYAGLPQTNQTILEHTIYSNANTDTTICYKIDIPSTQISGEYEGSVTYTASGRP